ncbi:UNVERIFIED_CONTAM: hypothetical protein HDU68_009869 [Siphonaria sp. JEL0065]|nr:hypothetical protein HDU68_009869 [Siphonaria sp. JEL0065]
MDVFLIKPKLAEFSEPSVPMDELAVFYTTIGLQAKEGRPYIWSNSMTTLDGYMHFKATANQVKGEAQIVAKNEYEHGSIESDVALKRHPDAGPYSLADYRLLNAGWVFADAVLSSGPCVRTDPLLRHVPIFKDMQHYRQNTLKKPFAPFQILVSSTASSFAFDSHAMFNSSDIPVVVASLSEDVQRAEESYLASRTPLSNSRLWNPQSDPLHAPGTVRFVSFPASTKDPRGIDLNRLAEWLKQELDVTFLEIDAGGSMIRKMIDDKLIDEVRLTQVGHVIGVNDSTGLPRPSLFNCPGGDTYDADHSPVFRMAAIRSIGDHFLFLRTILEYRH